jgi:putative ABC transport system permease protein
MGILLHAGRDLSRHDDADGAAVAIVNAAFVRRFIAGGSPIGRRLTLYGEETPRAIVGIVGDVRHVDLAQPPAPEIYIPVQQAPAANMTLVIRSIDRAAAPPVDVARGVVARLDADLPLYNVQPMATIVSRSLFLQRAPMQLMIAFAGLAVTLAALGLYSVVSFMVSRRRHEIGVRVALGAGRRDILRLIVGRGMLLAGAGLVIGFGTSLALGRALSSLLFGVDPTDPPTLAAVVALLTAVTCLASYLPARRAAAIDPAETLRNE